MADISVPYLTAKDIIDILGSAAQRENAVLVRIQPYSVFASLIQSRNDSLEVVACYSFLTSPAFSKSLTALRTVLSEIDSSLAMVLTLGHAFFSFSQRSYR